MVLCSYLILIFRQFTFHLKKFGVLSKKILIFRKYAYLLTNSVNAHLMITPVYCNICIALLTLGSNIKIFNLKVVVRNRP